MNMTKEEKKKYNREWYEKHREEELRKKREKYNANKEYYLEKVKLYQELNKDKKSSYMRKRYSTIHGRALRILNSCKVEDKKKGRIGDELPSNYVTVQWIEKQIQKGCAHKDICGVTDWSKIGINRIDNSKPHTIDNCEPCCWECNNRLHHEEMSIRIDQIDKVTGEILHQWESSSEAANKLGYKHDGISRCGRGERKTYNGYIWKRPIINKEFT